MRIVPVILTTFLTLPCLAADLSRERLEAIDTAVEAAIRRGDCPGAVVVVVHQDQIVYRKAFGHRALRPEPKPMTPDTVFDLASLTKPVATATAVVALVEQGKLRLSEKVATYWPEFAAAGKDNVTVEHLLIHTSGLIADNPLADYRMGRDEALTRIARLSLLNEPGSQFRYSDVGFIVLGHLVERVSGKPVDEFVRDHVFAPLGMSDTCFRPGDKLRDRCAPTHPAGSPESLGVVHDPRARAMGGVAGHAGLFATADDLARYARMLLNGGQLNGKRVLGPLTVRHMTVALPVPGGLRSRGWDVDTAYSSPRGELFPPGEGFGHTGFTGTSLWFDPPSRTAIILLTSRVHLSDRVQVTSLRRAVANIVAGAISGRSDTAPTGKPPTVLCGIDVLERDRFRLLKDRKIGLVTTAAAQNRRGECTEAVLRKAEGVNLVHRLASGLETGPDPAGNRRNAEALKGIDTLVIDLPDSGCRFDPALRTLGVVLDLAAEHHIPVVVLDRPNPLGGTISAGPTGSAWALPPRHGMTMGELAQLIVASRKVRVELEVVTCQGWRRADPFDRTGLTWVDPAQDIRGLSAALLFPGLGLLETTGVSVGRGTDRPYEWAGAPWLDGPRLAMALNAAGVPGLRFLPARQTPKAGPYAGQPCDGVQVLVTEWAKVDPVRAGVAIACALRDLYPDQWRSDGLAQSLGNAPALEAFRSGEAVAAIEQAWQRDLRSFRDRRRPFLLYPE